MKKHFYTHLIEIKTIHISLDEMELEVHEKNELVEIMESTIHHVVVDTVLTELSPEDKKEFFSHLGKDDHDKMWEFLNTKIKEPHQKIKKAVSAIAKELHTDIHEAKKHKPKKQVTKKKHGNS